MDRNPALDLGDRDGDKKDAAYWYRQYSPSSTERRPAELLVGPACSSGSTCSSRSRSPRRGCPTSASPPAQPSCERGAARNEEPHEREDHPNLVVAKRPEDLRGRGGDRRREHRHQDRTVDVNSPILAEFLDVDGNPQLLFKSSSVRLGDDGRWRVGGDLTACDIIDRQLDVEYLVDEWSTCGQHLRRGLAAPPRSTATTSAWTWNQAPSRRLPGKTVQVEINIEVILDRPGSDRARPWPRGRLTQRGFPSPA